MESGSSRLLVVPRAGGGWQLREKADGPPIASPGSKHEAVSKAQLLLETGRGGQVVVLAADGAVQQTLSVEPAGPRPWWYVRPGVWRWVVPLVLLPQVLNSLVTWRTSPLTAVLAVLGVALLALYAWCLLRSVRLERARAPREVDPG